jgi:hypothetical protein
MKWTSISFWEAETTHFATPTLLEEQKKTELYLYSVIPFCTHERSDALKE